VCFFRFRCGKPHAAAEDKGESAMKNNITKLIIVPVDGSKISLRTLGYIHMLYGTEHNLKITLMHILPSLPPIMVEESAQNRKTA
jgi:hypothetical protein